MVPVEFQARLRRAKGYLRTGAFAVVSRSPGPPSAGRGGRRAGPRLAEPGAVVFRSAARVRRRPSSFADGSRGHQLALTGSQAGGADGLGPFVEAGLGWLVTIVPVGPGQTQGDWTGWGAPRLSTGGGGAVVAGRRAHRRLRDAAVKVDQARRYASSPAWSSAAAAGPTAGGGRRRRRGAADADPATDWATRSTMALRHPAAARTGQVGAWRRRGASPLPSWCGGAPAVELP